MELDGFLEWKIVGYVIGAMCVSVNVIIYVVLHEMKSGVLEYILLALNVLVALTWILGVILNKTPLLLVLIVWLSIPAVVCVLFLLFAIVCVIIDVIHGPYTGGDVPGNAIGRFFEGIMYAVFLGSVFLLSILTLAVLCYLSMRKALNGNQLHDIPYTQAENGDFNN